MMAMLAAAAILAQPGPAPKAAIIPSDTATIMRTRACTLWNATPVRRTVPAPEFRKLGDLPKANLEIAVLRLDGNGCTAPVIVRYGAEGDGRAANR